MSRTVARGLLGGLVVMLAVGAVALTALAIAHVQPSSPNAPVGSVPTHTETPLPSPSPTSTPPAPTPPPLAAHPRAEQRFIAGGDGVLWRGTAGACAGAAPTLERSTDEGTTWNVVTPEYLGIGELIDVAGFAGTQAEIIAGVGPECEVQLLRTFTQGEFWESYPDVLAGASYVDRADAGRVVRAGSPIDAPCDDARSLQRAGESLAVVCAGTAYMLVEQAWTPLDVPGVVVASDDGDGVLLASVESSCTGLALTRVAPDGGSTDAGCIEVAAPSAPAALRASPETIELWSGNDWVVIPR